MEQWKYLINPLLISIPFEVKSTSSFNFFPQFESSSRQPNQSENIVSAEDKQKHITPRPLGASSPFSFIPNQFQLIFTALCHRLIFIYVSSHSYNRSAVGGVCRRYCCVRHKRPTNHNNAVSLAVWELPSIDAPRRRKQSKHSVTFSTGLCLACEKKERSRRQKR